MRIITIIFISIISLLGIYGCNKNETPEVTIGIIEPLEHTAMNEIVAGFTETLSNMYHKPVVIKVENAQGDANLQRAIIQKMRDAHYTMIVPIGVGPSQMTLGMTRTQPVVSLASDISDKERKHMHPCHAAVVHDEISAEQLFTFIHTAYPALTNLMLIHSAADKVIPQVNEAIKAGKKLGITVDHHMVATLPELYTVTKSIPSSTQGIVVLKDSLIVSGIATLAKEAATRKIPLITSDQGSVLDGATLALGVHEKQIGIDGAKLAAEILSGKSACELPIVNMKKLVVFVNQKAMSASNQAQDKVDTAAKSLGYNVELLKSAGQS